MKRALKIGGIFLIILVVALMVVPFLIPVESYKNEMIHRVKQATGRDLKINGAIRATLFPRLGIYLEDVSLSNGKNYSDAEMLHAKSITVNLALKPLLGKEIEVTKLFLDEPIIHLEKDKEGVPNWQFTPIERSVAGKTKVPAHTHSSGLLIASAHAQENPETKTLSKREIRQLSLGKVEIYQGAVYYNDRQKGIRQDVTQLNLSASMPQLNQPMKINGDAVWNKENVGLVLRVNTPAKLLAGEKMELSLDINSRLALFIFNGAIGEETVQGKITLRSPSAIELSSWLSLPVEGGKKIPQLILDSNGKLDCAKQFCNYQISNAQLNDIEISGRLSLLRSKNLPFIGGKLKVTDLDLTNYFPDTKKGSITDELSGMLISPAYAAQKEWSTKVYDFSTLKLFNGAVKLTVDKLEKDKITVRNIDSMLKLKDGVADIDIKHMELYGGEGTATAKITLAQPMKIAKKASFKEINMHSFLEDIFGFDKLEGTGALDFDINVEGNTEKSWMESLEGSGKLQMRNGKVRGINIVQLIKKYSGILGGEQLENLDETRFIALGASFNAEAGVMKNNDLLINAPLLDLTGKGQVNLGNKTVNYMLYPALKVGIAETFTVPVEVTGNFERLSFKPDMEAATREGMKNPELLKTTVEAIKEKFKESKERFKDAKEKFKTDPQSLRELFKGITPK